MPYSKAQKLLLALVLLTSLLLALNSVMETFYKAAFLSESIAHNLYYFPHIAVWVVALVNIERVLKTKDK